MRRLVNGGPCDESCKEFREVFRLRYTVCIALHSQGKETAYTVVKMLFIWTGYGIYR